ncbi:pteridine reductase [Aestuariibacter sp. AA17]|uniref:Pteridine reductase n=1 Tax=Fluctibacter corallii TaxID=2984329 RepID=A0ABT3A928_9ALTE|nr:pteridine reductase [Aestuariibacter sp. AA17]MCV2885171.1 pteridine reductase [Aestuariibacter sp. AA17]
MSGTPVALITGSAKRIGAHIAGHLHQLGYNIVLHYHHSEKDALSLCSQLNQTRPHSCKVVQGDLCNVSDVAAVADNAIQAFSKLNVLINNASSFFPTPFGEITPDHWHHLVGSNLQGPLFLSQACLPTLKANRGVIINMADIHVERPLARHSVYTLAKAGLVNLTKSLACELAPDIRVNAVAPGAILWPEAPLSESEKAAVLASIPANRLGSAQDIAEAIAYLIRATYVTGQVISVDGGRSIASNAKA